MFEKSQDDVKWWKCRQIYRKPRIFQQSPSPLKRFKKIGAQRPLALNMLCSLIICLKNCHGFCFVIATTEKMTLNTETEWCSVTQTHTMHFDRDRLLWFSLFPRCTNVGFLFRPYYLFHKFISWMCSVSSFARFKRVICIGVRFAGHNDDDTDFFRVFFLVYLLLSIWYVWFATDSRSI